MSSSLVHLLGGTPGVGGARSARIISSDGTPLEVFIGGANAGGEGDTGGLFGALGGMFNSPFASNPGDYAFGNLSNIINQLMQNDPNRVRCVWLCIACPWDLWKTEIGASQFLTL